MATMCVCSCLVTYRKNQFLYPYKVAQWYVCDILPSPTHKWSQAKGPSIKYVSIFFYFFDPPIHYVSIDIVLNVNKNWHFLYPTTQSFWWRSIWMVPKGEKFFERPLIVTILDLSHLKFVIDIEVIHLNSFYYFLVLSTL